MALLNDRVFDEGLTVLDTEANELIITTASETLVWATLQSQKLGTKTSPTVAAPADRTGGGRQVTCSAITDGSVSASDDAAVFALVDTANTRVLMTEDLASAQAVNSGDTFTLTEFEFGFTDPAAGFFGDRVLDTGLTALTDEGDEVWITSTESLDYATLNAAKLGTKTTPTLSSPADRTGGGREVTLSAFSDGSVSSTGTATHYAVVDTVNSRVLAVRALASSKGVTSGNSFSLTEVKLGIADPA